MVHRRFVLPLPWRRATVACLAALCLSLGCRSARAFERQWHLGAGLGVASYAKSDAGISPALGVHGAYGLSDMFDLRLELMASRHADDAGRDLAIYSAAAGLTYKLDVLEWIPYFGVLGGVYSFHGQPAPENKTDLALSAIFGLDYAWSRSFGLGVALRYNGLLLDAPKSFSDAAYFSGLLRAEYRFGW